MNTDANAGFHVVIPARFASTRFPGKPLHPLLGKPMILHVVERANASGAQSVVVATDDDRIAEVCANADVEVVMTRADHLSGTDRIVEVAKRKNWQGSTRIVGLQGDEPGMPSSHIDRLAANLNQHPDAAMATLCFPVQSYEDWQNPDRVKVVKDHKGMALYFSRSPIPFLRDSDAAPTAVPSDACIHIGIYAYRAEFLNLYASLKSATAHGVDRPDDVLAMEKILQEQTKE